MWHKGFLYVLNYLKIFEAAIQKQSMDTLTATKKKAVLSAAAYFRVFTPVRVQRQQPCSVIFVYQKRLF